MTRLLGLIRRVLWRWRGPRYRRGSFVVCPLQTPHPEEAVDWLTKRGVLQPTAWRGPDGLIRATGIVGR